MQAYPRYEDVAGFGSRHIDVEHVAGVAVEVLNHLATLDVPDGAGGVAAAGEHLDCMLLVGVVTITKWSVRRKVQQDM